ncbi:DNA gyrase subunit A [Nocardioides sp. J9]|uniref:DNA gyrase subunit A n=1 Tax=Nocardioides sp. J9 TaxID=935844 RepID=UPI0011AC3C76|nr:DNA gyrase subunit A [Nocardioides sp. J9]TWG91996.1 DNA gyrase subunit A [Nocardioides sp. J9]
MRGAEESLSDQIRLMEERLHVMDALARALAEPRKVLELILDAPNVEAAQSALRQAFGFDATQASAVTDMQFRRAATNQRKAIEHERDEIASAVARMRQGI